MKCNKTRLNKEQQKNCNQILGSNTKKKIYNQIKKRTLICKNKSVKPERGTTKVIKKNLSENQKFKRHNFF